MHIIIVNRYLDIQKKTFKKSEFFQPSGRISLDLQRFRKFSAAPLRFRVCLGGASSRAIAWTETPNKKVAEFDWVYGKYNYR